MLLRMFVTNGAHIECEMIKRKKMHREGDPKKTRLLRLAARQGPFCKSDGWRQEIPMFSSLAARLLTTSGSGSGWTFRGVKRSVFLHEHLGQTLSSEGSSEKLCLQSRHV